MNYLNSVSKRRFFKNAQLNGYIYKLNPIVNAVTICNLASFETGELPSVHGILGHNFGSLKNGALTLISGPSKRYETEAFWEKADLNGKEVLSIGSLVLHGKYENHQNVDCFGQGEQINPGKLIQLVPFKEGNNALPVKYLDLDGNAKIKLNNSVSMRVDMVIKDGKNILILQEGDDDSDSVLGRIRIGEWLEIKTNTLENSVEALRLKWVSFNNDSVKLYVRPSYKNRGYPEIFLKELDLNVGPSKGSPNLPYYLSNKITENTLIEEINWEMNYLMDSFTYSVQKKNYDLIMIDYPLMDRYGHGFLKMMDTSNRVKDDFQKGMYKMSNDLKKIQSYANIHGYDLIVFSGHGFSPIHTSININKLLEENGVVTNTDNPVWKAKGIPGKVSAHIYVNDNLSVKNKKKLIEKIVSSFENLTDEQNKEIVVDNIFDKKDLDKIGMKHGNAGDLFVYLKPGYVFQTDGESDNSLFGIPTFNGDHGYSSRYNDSFGVYISNEPCESCKTTEIAKIITKKLSIN